MRRNLLTLALSTLIVLSFGLIANAGTMNVELSITGPQVFVAPITPGYQGSVGRTSSITLSFKAKSDFQVTGTTLGWRVYSPDASVTNVTWIDIDSVGAWATAFNLGGTQLVRRSFDGVLPDSILTGGAALGGGWGPFGALQDIVVGSMTLSNASDGKLCVDTTFIPPAGKWTAAPNNVTPSWGPYSPTGYCLDLFLPPCIGPAISNPVASLSVGHCNSTTYDFNATDANVPSALPLVWSVSAVQCGTASINPSTGVLTWDPGDDCCGLTQTVTVSVANQCGASSETTVDLVATNVAPQITCPPNVAVSKGSSNTSPNASVVDPDACDAKVYSLVSVTPAPIGTVTVNPATGAVTFNADNNDAGPGDRPHTVCIAVSDGCAADTCCFTFTVLFTEPFCLLITQNNDPAGVIQGTFTDICIVYDGGSNTVGGFDLLISYDNSVMSLTNVSEGNIYADYKWEYFTYRFGPSGNCSGGCPSGKVRIVGLAETNNGAVHPTSQSLALGDTLACLTFLVSDNRTFECSFAPIRFFWIDCGDNALSSYSGDTLYISSAVYDYVGTGNQGPDFDRADITGIDQVFPTLTGAPDQCDVSGGPGKPAPIRFICFENGGFLIACADSIDARGDVNLNGLANEIADAVVFTQYFIQGLGAFNYNVDGQVAATEINGDGIPLSVADLVYLIRIIVGDALPLPKTTATSALITTTGNVVSTNVELGAALFVFKGETSVDLLAPGMAIKTGVRDGNTYALVYPNFENSNTLVGIEAGQVVRANSGLVSAEVADLNGNTLAVATKVIPTSFSLSQNYPNPFNPTTKVAFELPVASTYSLTIYNVAGQKVAEYNGQSEAGKVEMSIDAAKWSSGVYFYKLTAGSFSATKKMALLK